MPRAGPKKAQTPRKRQARVVEETSGAKLKTSTLKEKTKTKIAKAAKTILGDFDLKNICPLFVAKKGEVPYA